MLLLALFRPGAGVPLHGDPWLLSGPWWTNWVLNAPIVLGILALAAWYIWAMGPLNQRSPGTAERPVTTGERTAFLAGCLVLLVALTAPLEDWAGLLLTAHMVQHVLLTLVVPPLILLGIPAWCYEPLLKRPWLNRIGYGLTRPLVALGLTSFTFVVWHIPDFYNLALLVEPVHILQHGTYLFTSFLAWWPVLGKVPAWPKLAPLPMCLYFFGLTIAGGLVGAFISVGEVPMYGYYATVPRAWGLDLAMDQQMAGLIMWLGVNAFYFALITIVFLTYATREEAKDRARPVSRQHTRTTAPEPSEPAAGEGSVAR